MWGWGLFIWIVASAAFTPFIGWALWVLRQLRVHDEEPRDYPACPSAEIFHDTVHP